MRGFDQRNTQRNTRGAALENAEKIVTRHMTNGGKSCEGSSYVRHGGSNS